MTHLYHHSLGKEEEVGVAEGVGRVRPELEVEEVGAGEGKGLVHGGWWRRWWRGRGRVCRRCRWVQNRCSVSAAMVSHNSNDNTHAVECAASNLLVPSIPG
jgi:hypothetical protein